MRPEPPTYQPAEGYVWTVVPDEGLRWRVVTDLPTSRMMGCRGSLGPGLGYCHRNSVARMDRGRSGRERWFFYCADHLYGRWIEDGQVMSWAARKEP